MVPPVKMAIDQRESRETRVIIKLIKEGFDHIKVFKYFYLKRLIHNPFSFNSIFKVN